MLGRKVPKLRFFSKFRLRFFFANALFVYMLQGILTNDVIFSVLWPESGDGYNKPNQEAGSYLGEGCN
jgi:hypothetical protein